MRRLTRFGSKWFFSDLDLRIEIRDDGKGFDLPANSTEFAQKGHFGLLGLHERAELIAAGLRIESTPGGGTTVSIKLNS